ncbi:hypothetical protein VTI74DRAFT_11298 [Chaetomium olivicolor]
MRGNCRPTASCRPPGRGELSDSAAARHPDQGWASAAVPALGPLGKWRQKSHEPTHKAGGERQSSCGKIVPLHVPTRCLTQSQYLSRPRLQRACTAAKRGQEQNFRLRQKCLHMLSQAPGSALNTSGQGQQVGLTAAQLLAPGPGIGNSYPNIERQGRGQLTRRSG